MKKMFLFLSLLLFYPYIAMAGNFSAGVEPQQVPFGETVQFELSYEGNDAGNIQPDLSVLQKDFTIYSTSTSMQSSYVNGVGSQKRVWTLLLMPKSQGKLQIPAISAGGYQTTALEIEVLPAGTVVGKPNNKLSNQLNSAANVQNSASAADLDKRFWAELAVDNKNPYIGQEINATLVIYDQLGVDIQQLPMFADNDDWIIEMLGDPEITEKNGQRVIKLQYSLFAQKSGELTIPSARIDGMYTDFSRTPVTNSIDGIFKLFEVNFDFAHMLGSQKPIMRQTQPISVTVKQIPEDYGDYEWLPATALVMNAKWSDSKPVFKVGEAVTREITVLAAGAAETSMPEITFREIPEWKQYPEKPQINTVMHNGKRIIQAVTRIVYIPQKGGEQTVPEIKLRWFNTRTNHIETAVVPSEKMYVGGVENTEALPPAAAENNADIKQSEPTSTNIKSIEKKANKLMQWIWIVVAFVAGLFVSLLLLQRRLKKEGQLPVKNDSLQQIEQCLKQNDYRGLRDNLLQWGESRFPSDVINNLNDLARVVADAEFSEQMAALSSILYANADADLDKSIILKCLKKSYGKTKNKNNKPLPDLYK